MIEIITRIRYRDLYDRMTASAQETAVGPLLFSSETDPDGIPNVVDTYNKLGRQSNADILVFCHDDTVFMEDGWDRKLENAFSISDADIIGIVGTDKYSGGTVLSAGRPHLFGKYVTFVDGKQVVKIFSPSIDIKKVTAIDAFFIAISSDFFKREQFDSELDGLWFSDIDICLRSNRVFLADILMGHWKPKELYGVYPKDMKPIESYEPYFYKKHGLSRPPVGDLRCVALSLNDFKVLGQDRPYREYERHLVNA